MSDIIPAGDSLDDLARRINEEHHAAAEAFTAGLAHARQAGQLLLEAKKLVPHGGWLPWLRDNCTVSERTAQAYMRVAKRWPELEANPQRVADLSYRDAIGLLAERPAEPKPGDWFDVFWLEVVPLIGDALRAVLQNPEHTLSQLQAVKQSADDLERFAHGLRIDSMTRIGQILCRREPPDKAAGENLAAEVVEEDDRQYRECLDLVDSVRRRLVEAGCPDEPEPG